MYGIPNEKGMQLRETFFFLHCSSRYCLVLGSDPSRTPKPSLAGRGGGQPRELEGSWQVSLISETCIGA